MVRPSLRYLLLDDFDPETGELALRVAFRVEEESQLLRLKLHLGRSGDPLDPLRRQLRTHLQMSPPPLWESGLRTIIHALEEELDQPEGRNPLRYLWVQTQVMHPSEPGRSTLNHPVAQQVEILREWSLRLDQDGESIRAAEFLERLLLLAPRDRGALARLTSFFREQRMAEEVATLAGRWLGVDHGSQEARLRLGEALLALDRLSEARSTFEAILKIEPLDLKGHLGMAQALARLGGDPFPHLDAAMELDQEGTRSVLRETFDYRLHQPPAGERTYELEHLPSMLGLSSAEILELVDRGSLPATGPGGTVRESELARWVGAMNRYQLLPAVLNWSAPTPRRLPELA
ncbi:MAG TPA: hypothetical protein VJ600_09975 [Holophagaceae bacterium]|nr:hypothetical protein [Holophagaceae bacterium]